MYDQVCYPPRQLFRDTIIRPQNIKFPISCNRRLLAELAGFGTQDGVFVIAAMNRPEMVNSALRRSGRLGNNIVINRPAEQARADIFYIHLRERPVTPNGTPEWIAVETNEGVSGADIEQIWTTTARIALRDALNGSH